MRRFGIITSVTRWRSLPSGSRRSWRLFDGHVLEHVVAREHGFLLRRAHVGEEQAQVLQDRIPRLAEGLAVARAQVLLRRLARHVEAAALHVEEPAVIAAADTRGLDLAVVERGAAMAAAQIEEHADFLWAGGDVGRHGHGMPVAAEQFAAGVPGPTLTSVASYDGVGRP